MTLCPMRGTLSYGAGHEPALAKRQRSLPLNRVCMLDNAHPIRYTKYLYSCAATIWMERDMKPREAVESYREVSAMLTGRLGGARRTRGQSEAGR